MDPPRAGVGQPDPRRRAPQRAAKRAIPASSIRRGPDEQRRGTVSDRISKQRQRRSRGSRQVVVGAATGGIGGRRRGFAWWLRTHVRGRRLCGDRCGGGWFGRGRHGRGWRRRRGGGRWVVLTAGHGPVACALAERVCIGALGIAVRVALGPGGRTRRAAHPEGRHRPDEEPRESQRGQADARAARMNASRDEPIAARTARRPRGRRRCGVGRRQVEVAGTARRREGALRARDREQVGVELGAGCAGRQPLVDQAALGRVERDRRPRRR